MTGTAARPSRPRRLEDHPTVLQARAQRTAPFPPPVLDPGGLRELCLACGADDVGLVSLDRPELAEQRGDPAADRLRQVFSRQLNQPWTCSEGCEE
jgi:hypothetical protein